MDLDLLLLFKSEERERVDCLIFLLIGTIISGFLLAIEKKGIQDSLLGVIWHTG